MDIQSPWPRIGIHGQLSGKAVNWMEEVRDQQYQSLT